MSAAAPKPGSAGAQWLIAKGYKNQLRRCYFVQFVDDSVEEYAALTTSQKTALNATRLSNWRTKGVLPVRIFALLLQQWLQDGHILGYQNQSSQQGNDHKERQEFKLDLGFTYFGMQALGAHGQLLDIFKRLAPAFSEGADLRANRFLGDAGRSDPAYWQSHYRKQSTHAVLLVHAQAIHSEHAEKTWLAFESSIEKLLQPASHAAAVQAPAPRQAALSADWIEQSSILSDAAPSGIHFGMTDGISAPEFIGLHAPRSKPPTPPFNQHALGELLLGHDRNDGSNAWRWPSALPQASNQVEPRPLPERKAYAEFFKNASFGALRKMRQDVAAFDAYLSEQLGLVPENWPDDYKRGWLKAKMLGRWPNGEPLGDKLVGQASDAPRAMLATPQQMARLQPAPDGQNFENNFHYKNDRLGLGCPISAHVRRMNPRDDPVVPFLRRPILRRGVPYGSSADADKGLLGLFFCTSIEEQFEHLLGRWASDSPMGMPQSTSENDPLIGVQDAPVSQFSIPMPAPQDTVCLKNLPEFVQTLGTLYALFPSVAALQKIADGQWVSYTNFVKA